MEDELLRILRCPDDRTLLTWADDSLVRRLNSAIDDRRVTNRAGRLVEQSIDAGLVREDGTMLYPVHGGIPVLLIDDAIPLDQIVA